MNNIAIYGAGGLGREICCVLNKINRTEKKWNFIGFFDDGKLKGTRNEYGEIIGGLNELNVWQEPLDVILAIGNGNTVESVSKKITNPVISFPNICYETWFADKESLRMGKGNIVLGGSCISCAVEMGDFNVLNGFVNIGHDVRIGSYNSFMPGVLISGETIIGDNNFFGIRSVVIQQMTIKSDVRLGAGSVLMTKPKPNSLYIGNPAKIFKY